MDACVLHFTDFFAVGVRPLDSAHLWPEIVHVGSTHHVDESEASVHPCDRVHRHLEEIVRAQNHLVVTHPDFVDDIQHFLLYLFQRDVLYDQSGEW